MKAIALTLASVLASSFALAAPYEFIGLYSFKGEVKPLGRLTIDVVDNRMKDSAQRLKLIRENGGECIYVLANTLRCRTMKTGAVVPASSLEKIAERSKGLFVVFQSPTAKPSIVTEGEALVEWTIFQPGQWSAGDFKTYRYLEMPDLAKIILPGPMGSIELNTTDGKTLNKFESERVPESRWRWHEDIAQAVLAQ